MRVRSKSRQNAMRGLVLEGGGGPWEEHSRTGEEWRGEGEGEGGGGEEMKRRGEGEGEGRGREGEGEGNNENASHFPTLSTNQHSTARCA